MDYSCAVVLSPFAWVINIYMGFFFSKSNEAYLEVMEDPFQYNQTIWR